MRELNRRSNGESIVLLAKREFISAVVEAQHTRCGSVTLPLIPLIFFSSTLAPFNGSLTAHVKTVDNEGNKESKKCTRDILEERDWLRDLEKKGTCI